MRVVPVQKECYYENSVGVQGAIRLKPCNSGHLLRYLRSVYVHSTPRSDALQMTGISTVEVEESRNRRFLSFQGI